MRLRCSIHEPMTVDSVEENADALCNLEADIEQLTGLIFHV